MILISYSPILYLLQISKKTLHFSLKFFKIFFATVFFITFQSQSSYGAVIYSIDFENGSPGWTTGNLATTSLGFPSKASSWILTATSGGTAAQALGSTTYGTTNIGYQGAENSYIQSPAITIQGTQLTLTFDSYTSNEAGYNLNRDVERVEFSIDGGQTWTAMHGRIPTLNDVAYDTTWRTFNLTETVSPGTSITFRFRFDTGDGCCGPRDISGWFIDNVIVSSGIVFTANVTNNICYGDSAGTIDITASGGTAPYQYSFDNGQTFGTGNILSNLKNGTYKVMVKDATGDSSFVKNVKIKSPGEIQITAVQLTASCNGTNSGICEVNISGGKSPFQISIDNGLTWQTTNTFNQLAPGTYIAMVKDINNCVGKPDTFNIIQSNSNIVFTTNVVDAGCNGGGSIMVNASGGVAPYSISIDGGVNYVTDSIFDNLTANTYQIQVMDSSGCIGTVSSVTVNQIGSVVTFTDSAQSATCNLKNGFIIFKQASGGTGPYQYSINNGVTFQSSTVFDSLSTGTYYLQVKDALGCKSINKKLKIGNKSSSLNFSVNQINPACGLQNGEINILPTGGIAPYYCSIDSGATYHTTNNFTNLSSGTYNILVKDSMGCNAVSRKVIFAPNGSSVTSNAVATDASCGTLNDGSIIIHTSSGIAPFEFSIDSGATYVLDSTFYNLAPGTYHVFVRDNSTCYSQIQAVQINRAASALSFQLNSSPATCGLNNGTISVQAGSSGTLQFSVDSGATFQNAAVFSNLAPGSYPVCIKNINGCMSAIKMATISQSGTQVQFTSTVTGVVCGNAGEIALNPTSGFAPYEYSIDSGQTFVSTNNITNLAAGNYFVTVRDQKGCMAQMQQIAVPLISNAISFNSQFSDKICGKPGDIIFNATGGIPPYQYSIDNGLTYLNTDTFKNLDAGTYKLLVKDSTGCSSGIQTVVIQEINGPSLTYLAKQDSCSSYQVVLIATGGTKPYLYSIDNGLNYQSDSMFRNINSEYIVIQVKDAMGCIIENSVKLDMQNKLTANAGPDFYLREGSDTACIMLAATATGGKAPYTFSWSTAITADTVQSDSMQVCPTKTRFYVVKVQDAFGCSASDTVMINYQDIGSRTLTQKDNFIAYPNPFLWTSTILYRFNKESKYKLDIYDLQGRFITRLTADTGKPGIDYKINLQGDDFPEGCLMAVLKDDSGVRYLKLIIKK